MEILIVILVGFIIYTFLMITLLDKRLSSIEDALDKRTSVSTTEISDDDDCTDSDETITFSNTITITEKDFDDINLEYLGTQKIGITYYIEGLKVLDVEYTIGVIRTDKINIYLADSDQALYLREGDTINLLGTFFAGTSSSVYIRNGVLCSVSFGDYVLHIKNDNE